MVNYVLDRLMLDEFLDDILNFRKSLLPEISILVSECNYFSSEVHSNNYFLSKNIQKKNNNNNYPNRYLQNVYELQNQNSFYLEELNNNFIDFLITHTSNLEIDLDTHLQEIQDDFINSHYGKQVRY
jgi:hypothetical protein